MEIDFLGLISKHSSTQLKSKQNKSSSSFSGDEISLSLSTSSPDCQKDFLENTWKFHGEEIVPASCSSSSSFSSLAFHNLENAPRTEQHFVRASTGPFLHPYSITSLPYGLKNFPEHPGSPATISSLYAGCPSVAKDTLLVKSKNSSFTAGKSSMGPPSDAHRRGGYTPTVAMARKATLTRFLEKRSHRLTTRKAFLMGKFLDTTSSEASNMTSTSWSKKTKHRGRSS